MSLRALIPVGWQKQLQSATQTPSFCGLERFLEEEWREQQIFPARENIFNALALTPFEEVKVVILGQDPYHDDGQAHGLAFSVLPGMKLPPSLRNIFKELSDDTGISIPDHGCLEHWAKQGVLLLNAVLTVRAHRAASHQKKGWEEFTDSIIAKLNEKDNTVIFLLWGRTAQAKTRLIDTGRHATLQSAHPSPLSARNGFFKSRPFTHINRVLGMTGQKAIDWTIPNIQPSLL